MWKLLEFLFGGGGIGSWLKTAEEMQENYLKAQTDDKRIDAQERRDYAMQQASVLRETVHNRIENFIKAMFAVPCIIFLWKVLVIDKVFGWGVTDPLSPFLRDVFITVLGGYFLIHFGTQFQKWINKR